MRGGGGADVLQDPIHASAAQRDPPWLPCTRGSPIQWRPRTPLLPLEPCICAMMTLFILSFHMRVLSRQNTSPSGQHACLTVSGSPGSVPGMGLGTRQIQGNTASTERLELTGQRTRARRPASVSTVCGAAAMPRGFCLVCSHVPAPRAAGHNYNRAGQTYYLALCRKSLLSPAIRAKRCHSFMNPMGEKAQEGQQNKGASPHSQEIGVNLPRKRESRETCPSGSGP